MQILLSSLVLFVFLPTAILEECCLDWYLTLQGYLRKLAIEVSKWKIVNLVFSFCYLKSTSDLFLAEPHGFAFINVGLSRAYILLFFHFHLLIT